MREAVIGIVASALLAVAKVISGVFGHSYALVADGIESMLDMLSSLMVLGSLQLAAQPADERHPYGYGKAEPLAALAIATALLGAAAVIALQSMREWRAPQHPPEAWTLGVLVAVVAAKELLFRRLERAGAEIGSAALRTDAWHHRTDALTSLAAFLGIGIAVLGGPGFESADDVAALFAAGVIGFNGSRLFRSAWREILDVAPPPETVERLREVALGIEGVRDIETCRVRRSGLGMFVDIHVVVDGDLPVRTGHDIAHRVKDALWSAGLGVLDAAVHVEPDD
jgi:cation diffusion facilitator family transporter